MIKLKCPSVDIRDIEKYLKFMGIPEQKKEFIGALSKGSKSKVLLISALITKPKFAILDEPFRGMDLNALEKALLLVRNYHGEGGTILLSTHRTNLVEKLSPKVMVIRNKKIEKMQIGISERQLIDYLKMVD